MKHFKFYKTLQLILFLILTVVSLATVLTDKDLYLMVANNTRIALLCAILWFYFLLSFIFMYMDFTFHATCKKDYHELGKTVHSDPLAGIANRYSCDTIIEKYKGKVLPVNIGCIMLELNNLGDTNKLYGRTEGDTLIKSFSNILKLASVGLCFIGRNDGNKFLAIFENSSSEQMDIFLERVEDKINQYNSNTTNHAIQFCFGSAFSATENVKDINELISRANAKLNQ